MAKTITASTVRNYFREDASRVEKAGLSPEAKHTLREGARGRLHPEVIEAYNKKRRTTSRYAEGANALVKNERETQRQRLIAAGVEVGKRGPLTKAAKEWLAQNKG